MSRVRLFISYTMKDGEVTIEILCELKKQLSSFQDIDSYIDIIDNHDKNHQSYVIKKLNNSNVILLIKSSMINKSDWVNTELKVAKKKHIPIVIIELSELKKYLDDKGSFENFIISLYDVAEIDKTSDEG